MFFNLSLIFSFGNLMSLEWLVGEEKNHSRIDRMSVSSSRSFEYLESLPGTVFNKLYKQPSTALAIFRRMLPHLGR